MEQANVPEAQELDLLDVQVWNVYSHAPENKKGS